MKANGTSRQLLTLGRAFVLVNGLTGGASIAAYAQDPQNLPRPVITSVSAIIPSRSQVIIIKGLGFGHADSFNGLSGFIRLTDVTQDNWVAGYESPWRRIAGPVLVSKWTDTEIVIEAFPGYGQPTPSGHKQVFEVGDVEKIEVANPKGTPIPDPVAGAHPPVPVAVFSVRVSAAPTTAPNPVEHEDASSGGNASTCLGCVVTLSLAPSIVTPGGTVIVFGVVQEGSGKPASRATVEVTVSFGESLEPIKTTTHSDGTFGVPMTAPNSVGTVTIHARLAGAPRAASVVTTLKVAPN
jgi:hypothetical protein